MSHIAEKKPSDPGRTLALLWGTAPAAPARGPRPKFSLEEVVSAGIHVADTDGLDALSMRRVADHLGIGTMSVYTYVPGRSELLHLMYDRAMGPTPPLPEGTTWRQALRHYAELGRDLFDRHPWTLRVSGPGLLLMSPNSTARSEAVYAALAPLGLPGSEQYAIAATLDGYVRGICQSTADIAADFTGPDDYGRWWEEATPHLTALIARDRFPHLYDLWEQGAFEVEVDHAFGFGLDRILDGIERHLDAR
ncbi:TetR/AcrR family transcriptional regulator [Actinocorallia longicatena]|uniref:TetR/AcrR family transcriptional regulator n=1 Tax=Actinocorallia longicatena TaxID=111803 RepID=A0ABP6QL06_9ACTN